MRSGNGHTRRNEGFFLFAIFSLVLLVLVGGCAPRPEKPLPLTPGLEQKLLKSLDENAEAVSSLRGITKIRVKTADRTVSGRQVLLAQEPDRFRAEALSPFGNPLMIVATDGAKVRALLPSEGRYFEGEASYENLVRFTALPLELKDLLRILLYRIPVIAHDRSSMEAGSEGYLLRLAGSGLRQELLFGPELHLLRASWYRKKDLVLRVEYDQFTQSPPDFPRTIFLEVPTSDVEASLKFTELEVNPHIPAERFVLSPPPGYAIEPLP